MSQHSTILRQGLTAVTAAAALLAGGLIAAPAAQAAPPIVDRSERGGTVVTTRMDAASTDITGNAATDTIEPVQLWYDVDLRWTGGELRSFDGTATLQGVDAAGVRRFPITLDADGDQSGEIRLPGRIAPGFYRVGVEYTAVIERPDGRLVRHRVDVDEAAKVSIRREARISGDITNPEATDGRPSRITGQVRWLRISGAGDLTWSPLRNTTVRLYHDPDGYLEFDEEPVYVRTLAVGQDGRFATVVPAREGAWDIRYAGNDWIDRGVGVIPQGRDGGGCGC